MLPAEDLVDPVEDAIASFKCHLEFQYSEIILVSLVTSVVIEIHVALT